MRRFTLLLVSLIALAAAGCGDDGGDSAESGKPVTLKVGLLPISDYEPTIDLIAEQTARFGIVEEQPDVEAMIWEGAR